MPTYTFENTETGEVVELHMSFSEHDKYKEDNPHMKQLIMGAPSIVSGVVGMGRLKNDDGWREMQSKIAEAHPSSPFADQFGKKSIKEIKTKQVVEKHRKIQQAKQKN